MNVVTVPQDYKPDDKEEFMNPVMREFFRQKLLNWREDLLKESNETLASLQEDGQMQVPDVTDRASEETDRALELRTRDRERKLINKINSTLKRVDTDDYGYCEETGDPIKVKRLMARPIATLSIEAQERHERNEKTHRDH